MTPRAKKPRNPRKPTATEIRNKLARWEVCFGHLGEPEDVAHQWRALMGRADIARTVEVHLKEAAQHADRVFGGFASTLRQVADDMRYERDRPSRCDCWVCRKTS